MTDNPQAFPRTGEGVGSPRYDVPGMSLRDYFAGQVVSAIAIEMAKGEGGVRAGREGTLQDLTAAASYMIADAMLLARKVS